jgi:hypothetical protein
LPTKLTIVHTYKQNSNMSNKAAEKNHTLQHLYQAECKQKGWLSIISTSTKTKEQAIHTKAAAGRTAGATYPLPKAKRTEPLS